MRMAPEGDSVRRPIRVFLVAAVSALLAGCWQGDAPSPPIPASQKTQTNPVPGPTATQSESKGDGYEPPTAEEMGPMHPEYLAELAKIHEPPEMVGKPMQVRKAVSPRVLKLRNVMDTLGSPEKATHAQRATAFASCSRLPKARTRRRALTES
jgi:hypothetical protein